MTWNQTCLPIHSPQATDEVQRMPPSGAEPERRSVYLQPGQLIASAEPMRVTTILGSCIAVCLWDPGSRVGGVNHYLLPYRTRDRVGGDRFGSVAIPRLIERVTELGARKPRLVAKVFGGACVIGGTQRADHLGLQNTRLALETLSEKGIPVAARDVGGTRGRKLVFHTDDGSAWLKLL